MRNYLRERPERMSNWLDCVEDELELDVDGDGYGRCYADCDDDDAAVNPTSEEICDGIDNNYSQNVDDSLQCPCASAEIDGVTFYRDRASWDDLACGNRKPFICREPDPGS